MKAFQRFVSMAMRQVLSIAIFVRCRIRVRAPSTRPSSPGLSMAAHHRADGAKLRHVQKSVYMDPTCWQHRRSFHTLGRRQGRSTRT
jgi:hypothetical protein